MSAPRLTKLAAILAGLALAGAAATGVHRVVGNYFEQQGVSELGISGRRVIALTEMRLGRAIEALDDLVARGVASCAGEARAAMHDVMFRAVPVKEISLSDADGGTQCTTHAAPFGSRIVLSPPIAHARHDVVVDVVQIADRENAFRIRRTIGEGLELAALVPVEMLLPRISQTGGPIVVSANLVAGGLVIGARRPANAAKDDAQEALIARTPSDRFGVEVTAWMPRARAMEAHAGAMQAATVGTGVTVALLFALAAFGLRRTRGDSPAAELARAIRNGELVPYYQPIVDLTDARVVSAEVLVRWRKGDGTLVPPVRFIPLAEQSGLIVELTRALMRRVCAEAGAEIARREHFRIGFNLSARHFADETIVGDIATIFTESTIRPSQVLLEVTERQALDNLTVARRVIAALQGLGVHVGIDDLGTGHSGLSYMLKLGVDFIKIDKMFVDAIDTERYSTTIIETLVHLARDMRMEIIAEGVETFEQVQHLRARGIRKAQGYVFAPPLPGSSFLKLLAATDAGALPGTAESPAEQAAA